MKFAMLSLVFVAGCFAGATTETGTSQADCDKIAQEIRDHAGTRAQGICSSTVQTDIDRYGKACRALEDCEAHVIRP